MNVIHPNPLDAELTLEVRRPTREGWWCRNQGGRQEWFYVQRVEEDTEAGKSDVLVIWVTDIEDYLNVDMFCTPLTRWAGPVKLPWAYT